MSAFRRAVTLLAIAALFGPLGSTRRCLAQADGATQSAAPAGQTAPHEPGTGSPALTPASKAPQPVQAPDVRLDSKPHTDLDNTLDSSLPPPDLGLGASPEMDLGHDIEPVMPAGMLSRSEPDNPRMVYFSLPVRSGDEMTPEDRATLAARQADLVHAAAHHGFHLDDTGWSARQEVCPAMQPEASETTGTPAAGGGSLLMHYTEVRGDRDTARDMAREMAFVALIPRNPTLPVWVVPIAKGRPGKKLALSPRVDRAAVNEALPPPALYANLQPEGDWIAASACVAATQGASPSIPNEPFLSEEIMTAPPPLLRLMLNGQRKVVMTDRVSDTRYAVWDEHVSRRGRMVSTAHQAQKIVPRPVTNPPEPVPRTIAALPEPPSHTGPEPPSPLSGKKQ